MTAKEGGREAVEEAVESGPARIRSGNRKYGTRKRTIDML